MNHREADIVNPGTQYKIQLVGAWCGIGYIVSIFIGWLLIAGFMPPMSPATGAAQIAAVYQADYTRIRIGMIVVMISALLSIPFAAVLAQMLARIEGGAGVVAYTMLLGAAGNMALTFYPAIWWLVAAFRPERAPDLIYLMNDMAWLQFLGGVTLYLAMPLTCAFGAFLDASADPVFPRWSGFANIWLTVLVIPDQLLFFFHTGPFAWDGIFGFWLPVSAVAGFYVLNFYVVRAWLLRQRTIH